VKPWNIPDEDETDNRPARMGRGRPAGEAPRPMKGRPRSWNARRKEKRRD